MEDLVSSIIGSLVLKMAGKFIERVEWDKQDRKIIIQYKKIDADISGFLNQLAESGVEVIIIG